MTESVKQPLKWYCVRSQTKREHIAAAKLRDLPGIEVFCPRIKYRKPTSRGTIWWVEALFPGYLLARFDLTTHERCVNFCHGVRGLVRFGAEIPSVPDAFVENLKQEIRNHAAEAGDTLETSPTLEIGEQVEIAHGPLKGMSGTIISVAPADERVRVLLDFLGNPQPIDIDLFSLLLPRRPTP